MSRIRKIKIFAFARFQTLLMMFIGLLAGIIYSFGGLLIDILVSLEWITSSETAGLSYGTLLAFGALIAMPIMFAVVGFLVGIVEAVLYNLYGKWFGGVAIDFTQ